MTDKKTNPDEVDKAATAIITSGFAGAAVAVAMDQDPRIGFATGLIKGAAKSIAETLLQRLAEVRPGRAAPAENLVDQEFAAAVERDHAEAFFANLGAIPHEHQASEVAAAAAAATTAWRKSAGAKKRRVITAMFVNILDEETLAEGDGVRMLELVGSLDYAELYFLKHRFGSDNRLTERSELPEDQQRRAAERIRDELSLGTEGGERLHRLRELRLVKGDLVKTQQVFYVQRTWLGNRVLEYCGSDVFWEDIPGEE